MFSREKIKTKPDGLFNKSLLLVFILLFALVGTYLIINSFAATPSGTANLWIDNKSGTHNCTRVGTAGVSGEDYDTASNNLRACSSIEAAALKALPGDTIRMRAGTSYGTQTVTAVKTSPGITVIAEDGTSVAGITMKGAWIELQNIKSNGTLYWERVGSGLPHDIKFTNVDASGGFWNGGKNITWKGGTLGPNTIDLNDGPSCLQIQGIPDANTPPPGTMSDVTIDGLKFDGCRISDACLARQPDPCHTEVVRIDDGASNVTIKNSIFTSTNKINTAIIFTGSSSGAGSVNGLTLKNNYIAPASADSQPGLTLANGCRNAKILYNTWGRTMSLYNCREHIPPDKAEWNIGSTANVVAIGNLGAGDCISPTNGGSIAYSYNVWTNMGACGATDKGSQQVSFAADGYHLTSTSVAAIRSAADLTNLKAQASCSSASDPNLDVSTDIDGDARPQGVGCDAGADEYKDTGGGTSYLWVDTNGGNCSRSINYSDGTACTWDAAYDKAASNETIKVKGGTYTGTIAITMASGSTVSGVIFEPVNGEVVIINDFENGTGYVGGTGNVKGADNITFKGPVIARNVESNLTTGVTFDGWDIDCKGCTSGVQALHAEGVTNFTFKNGKVHDTRANSGQGGQAYVGGKNLVFENNDFYDAGYRSPYDDTHTECMYVSSLSGDPRPPVTSPATPPGGITLKGNHFYHCGSEDLFFGGSNYIVNGIIENNIFEREWNMWPGTATDPAQIRDVQAIKFRDSQTSSDNKTPDLGNLLIRNNTFRGTFNSGDQGSVVPNAAIGPIIFDNNIFLSGKPSCNMANTTYRYNAFASNPCGTNAQTDSAMLTNSFVNGSDNPGPGNWNLKSTATKLINLGNPASYTEKDRNGKVREGAPDIGAYEFISGTTPPPPPKKQGDVDGDTVVDIDDLSILLSKWNTNYTPADFLKDNIIDISDLSILLGNWGK